MKSWIIDWEISVSFGLEGSGTIEDLWIMEFIYKNILSEEHLLVLYQMDLKREKY